MSDIETINDFLIVSRGKTLAPLMPILITSRQQAFRTAAWIALMGEMLPNEEVASTFDEVSTAIRNT